jgi:hypothetical protein
VKPNLLDGESQAKLDSMRLTGFGITTNYEGERHWSIVVNPSESFKNQSYQEVWFDADTEEECIEQAFEYYLGLLNYAKTN